MYPVNQKSRNSEGFCLRIHQRWTTTIPITARTIATAMMITELTGNPEEPGGVGAIVVGVVNG